MSVLLGASLLVLFMSLCGLWLSVQALLQSRRDSRLLDDIERRLNDL